MTTPDGLRGRLAPLLPPTTRRSVAPPGRINASEPARQRGVVLAPPVIVASLMRSGTHLLIDTILNNFPAFRGRAGAALYCDLDRYLVAGSNLAAVDSCMQLLFKTHFPQQQTRWHLRSPGADHLEKLLARSTILVLERDPAALAASMARFMPQGQEAGALMHPDVVERFSRYWQPRADERVQFDELADPVRYPGLVARLARVLEQPEPRVLRRPPSRDQLAKVLLLKAGTRLLGSRMPVVNTTIGFALK